MLINEAPLQVLPSLAVALKNINEAIMLQQIQYWLQKSKNEYKGRKWIYNTISEWHEQFPWLTDRSIKARFDSLRKKGIIITANLNKNSFDHTNWYSIDYDALDKLLNDETQKKKPKNLDITDSEESSPSKKKNLPLQYQRVPEITQRLLRESEMSLILNFKILNISRLKH